MLNTPKVSSNPVALVAREYYANVRALQDKRCTIEQHRAENRRLRGLLTDQQWEQAKATALRNL